MFSRHGLLSLDLGILLDGDVVVALEGRDKVVGELGTRGDQRGCLKAGTAVAYVKPLIRENS